MGEVVSGVIQIPEDDQFGTTNAVWEVAKGAADAGAALLASHSYIRGYNKDPEQEELNHQYALRAKPQDEKVEFLETLIAQLKLKDASTNESSGEEGQSGANDMDIDESQKAPYSSWYSSRICLIY